MNPLLVGRRAIAGAVLCLSVFSNLPVFGRQAQPNSLVSSFQTTAAPVPTRGKSAGQDPRQCHVAAISAAFTVAVSMHHRPLCVALVAPGAVAAGVEG